MAVQFKMALVLAVMAAMHAHGGRNRDEDRNDDSMDIEEVARRSWQYEGIPIEAMLRQRRNEPAQTQSTDASTDTTVLQTTKPQTATQPQTTSELTTRKPTTTTTTTEHTTRVLPPLNKRYRRIFNPDEAASIEDHPYLAAVLMNNQLWCGGAIIGSDLVLTAAHCLQLQYNNRFFREYVKMLTVRVGSSNATSGGEHLRVDEIFFHPNYKPETLAFNYAVLRLSKNVTHGEGTNATAIGYTRRRDVTIDKTITFLGWGSVLGMGHQGGTVLLQKVDLPIYDKADCANVYGRELVSVSTFCAGFISQVKNVCNHDAGGPAIMDGELIGILSFSSKRCDEADKPAVFAGTGSAADWLDSIPEIRRKSDQAQLAWVDMQ